MNPISEEQTSGNPFFWSLDLCIFNRCCCFSLDRAPHVGPIHRFCDPTELGTQGHHQRRHLEWEEDRHSNSNWHVGDQRCIPHPL